MLNGDVDILCPNLIFFLVMLGIEHRAFEPAREAHYCWTVFLGLNSFLTNGFGIH